MARARVVAVYPDGAQAPPKDPSAVRLVLVSDTHEKAARLAVPPGDVLVHAGDWTYTGSPRAIAGFAGWLRAQPHAHKVVVAGNHDVTMDAAHYERAWQRYHAANVRADAEAAARVLRAECTYLENSSAEVCGLKFWGSPGSPEFCDWAFNLVGEQLEATWALIPADADVVVTHGPALGHGDVTDRGDNVGCGLLLRRLLEVRPALHVAGHIHEGYGVSEEHGITFVNASSVDLRYKPVNKPVVVDVAPGN
eukprot:m51a1_g1247 hypothetical protein (251) ;mRNA; r:12489-13320